MSFVGGHQGTHSTSLLSPACSSCLRRPRKSFRKSESRRRPLNCGQRLKLRRSVKVNLVEGLNLLMELARTDPRTVIKRSWLLLGESALRAANVAGDNVEPNSQEISASLKRLEASVQFSDRLISSIKNLQSIAMKVFYQSEWAYSPLARGSRGIYYLFCCREVGSRRGRDVERMAD